MFGLLKKKLRESVKKLRSKVVEIEIIPEEKVKAKKPSKKIKAGKAVKKKAEIIDKELEHIKEEQNGIEKPEVLQEEEIVEEVKEELAEEESEEEVESLKEPVVEPVAVEPDERIEEDLHIKKPKGRFGFLKEKLVKKVAFRKLTEEDVEDFFSDFETGLLEANVALEVIDFLKQEMKQQLVGTDAKRLKTDQEIKKIFEDSLVKVLDQGKVDFTELIATSKTSKKPVVVVVLGFNGSGKTTTIAKIANYLNSKGYKPVLAAGDTFRAAAIDQLETHGERIGVKVIKHQYGSDSAAVIFDAIKHAESKGADIVLADTAGRTHTNTNLIDELKKVVRVNKPDMKILVIDGLTGNDAVEQAKQFNSEIGVDAVVITKVDVDEKGGAILSVAYTIKKPILFLGTGQAYEDFREFNPREFVKGLLE